MAWSMWVGSDVIHGRREGVLSVEGIDFCIEANGEEHHTSKYSLMTRPDDKCLVVRRGQPFKLKIHLNRPYDAKRDAISFIFYVSDVEKSGPFSETTAAVPLLDRGTEPYETGVWSAVYKGQVNSYLKVLVTAAVDCIVTSWNIEVDTRLIGGSSLSYTHPLPIYLLFNPWCSNDSVYMPEDSLRDEYVEQDGGLIYAGVYNSISAIPWSYAQYEKDVLECALYLIRKVGKAKGKARGNPILTSRALSAAVNSQDDYGLLAGKWGRKPSDYDGGTSPEKWVGSLEIIQKYFKNKQSVKFGQCWVFAGVLTTIFRALGIPCRPVTCFNSAHDTEGSLTFDSVMYVEKLTNKITNDSVWNYHVWNEVWMDRPDLGAKYSGWQAVDSTPQETSEYIFRCGPAPVRAVRDGEIQRPYDCGYVFAEVNADQVFWKYVGGVHPYKFIKHDTTYVGKNISTKAIGKMIREKPPTGNGSTRNEIDFIMIKRQIFEDVSVIHMVKTGSDHRMDITNHYKYPEKSRMEREIMEKALRQSKHIFARYYLEDGFHDHVQCDIELQDDIIIGQDFTVVVNLNNSSANETRNVQGVLRVETVTYTGKAGEIVTIADFNVTMPPKVKEKVNMLVTFDEYYYKLVDQSSFKITCYGLEVETQHDFYAHDDFRMRNPDIKIAIEGEPKCRQEINVTLQVKNPLPITLHNGKFYVQGPGLKRQLKIQLHGDLEPGAMAKAEFKLTPQWAGRQQISAKFSSIELKKVDGFLSFMVARADSLVSENGFAVHAVEPW